MHTDAKSVGAHLENSDSPLHGLLDRARNLGNIQQLLRDWAQEPLSRSLRIANARDGVVVVYADSAAAFTQLRYRQQELLQLLREKLANPALTLEIQMRPSAQNSGAGRV
ncbi:MAG: hypothetical protein NVS9B10_27250 [Nevskia sp.]